MSWLVKIISVNLTVRSSSFVAASCATDGRMLTGGTERYCQMNSSGRLTSGSRPKSSQSAAVMFLKRLSTRRGFRSSCALCICGTSSLISLTAVLKVDSKKARSSESFLARYFSCIIFNAPTFLTVPLISPQCGHRKTFLQAVLTCFASCVRITFSRCGLLKRRRKDLLCSSDSRMREQPYRSQPDRVSVL